MNTLQGRLLYVFLFLTISLKTYAEKILVIESYHADFQWDIDYKKGIVDNVLGEHDFSYIQLDTKRLPINKHAQMVELAWKKYQDLQPDIVVLGDDNALKYLGPKLKNTGTPVVYLGINNNPRSYDLYRASNITGVLERPLLKRSILYLSKLFNQAEKALILFDSSPSAYAAVSMEFKTSNVMKLGRMSVEVDQIEQYSLWQQKVISAGRNNIDFIIVGLYQTLRDKQGNRISAKQVIEWTSKNSTVPVFGFWEFSIGKDMAIGGLVIEGYQQGYTAAQIINRIIAGEEISGIRTQVAKKGRYVFSKAEFAKQSFVIPDSMEKTIVWID
jgi:ABC-type uncharacterized transport system substrate-binding protein